MSFDLGAANIAFLFAEDRRGVAGAAWPICPGR